jgi:hypothetical protein
VTAPALAGPKHAKTYLEAQLEARALAGSMAVDTGKRVEAELKAFAERLSAKLAALPTGTDAARQAALFESRRIVTVAAETLHHKLETAIAEGRALLFTEVEELWQVAGEAAWDALGAGVPLALAGGVVTPALTLAGAYEALGGAGWKTALQGHIATAAQDIDAIVRRGLLEGVDFERLARQIRPYVAGAEEFHTAFGAEAFAKLQDLGKASGPQREAARKLTYNAKRIAYSEIHNARAEAEVQHYALDPMIDAVVWTLSPFRGALHGPDICDALALSDFYGLGPGVYPLDAVPLPPHPFDRCERVPRLRDPKQAHLPKPSGATRTLEDAAIVLVPPGKNPGYPPHLLPTKEQAAKLRTKIGAFVDRVPGHPGSANMRALMAASQTSETAKLLAYGAPKKAAAVVVTNAAQAALDLVKAKGPAIPPPLGAKANGYVEQLVGLGEYQPHEVLAIVQAEYPKTVFTEPQVVAKFAKLGVDVPTAPKFATLDDLTEALAVDGAPPEALQKWQGALFPESPAITSTAQAEELLAGANTAAPAELEAAASATAGAGEHEAVTAALDTAAGATETALPPKVLGASDILGTKVAGASGSNTAGVSGLWRGTDGRLYYVKQYKTPGQAYAEHLAGKAYHALGVGAPETYVFEHEGATVFASRYLEGTQGTLGKLGLTKARAEQVLDGFVADVWLANWDAVGTGLDNVVFDALGQAVRIDQGGALLYRAQGALKTTLIGPAELNGIAEWVNLPAGKAGNYFGQVFKAAGLEGADALGTKAIAQINRLETFVTSLPQGIGGWVEELTPGLAVKERAAIEEMLQNRYARLLEKRAELVAQGHALPTPAVPLATPAKAASTTVAELTTPAPLPTPLHAGALVPDAAASVGAGSAPALEAAGGYPDAKSMVKGLYASDPGLSPKDVLAKLDAAFPGHEQTYSKVNSYKQGLVKKGAKASGKTAAKAVPPLDPNVTGFVKKALVAGDTPAEVVSKIENLVGKGLASIEQVEAFAAKEGIIPSGTLAAPAAAAPIVQAAKPTALEALTEALDGPNPPAGFYSHAQHLKALGYTEQETLDALIAAENNAAVKFGMPPMDAGQLKNVQANVAGAFGTADPAGFPTAASAKVPGLAPAPAPPVAPAVKTLTPAQVYDLHKAQGVDGLAVAIAEGSTDQAAIAKGLAKAGHHPDVAKNIAASAQHIADEVTTGFADDGLDFAQIMGGAYPGDAAFAKATADSLATGQVSIEQVAETLNILAQQKGLEVAPADVEAFLAKHGHTLPKAPPIAPAAPAAPAVPKAPSGLVKNTLDVAGYQAQGLYLPETVAYVDEATAQKIASAAFKVAKGDPQAVQFLESLGANVTEAKQKLVAKKGGYGAGSYYSQAKSLNKKLGPDFAEALEKKAGLTLAPGKMKPGTYGLQDVLKLADEARLGLNPDAIALLQQQGYGTAKLEAELAKAKVAAAKAVKTVKKGLPALADAQAAQAAETAAKAAAKNAAQQAAAQKAAQGVKLPPAPALALDAVPFQITEAQAAGIVADSEVQQYVYFQAGNTTNAKIAAGGVDVAIGAPGSPFGYGFELEAKPSALKHATAQYKAYAVKAKKVLKGTEAEITAALKKKYGPDLLVNLTQKAAKDFDAFAITSPSGELEKVLVLDAKAVKQVPAKHVDVPAHAKPAAPLSGANGKHKFKGFENAPLETTPSPTPPGTARDLEAKKAFHDRWGPVVANMPKDEERALYHYTGSHYSQWNTHLRAGGVPTNEMQALDRLMRREATDRPLVTYRGIGSRHPLHGMSYDELTDLVGSEGPIDRGFVSTSTNEHTAAAFAHGGDAMIYEIHMPAGQHGIWAAIKGSNTGESEFILPRNTRYRVTAVRREDRQFGPTSVRIVVEVIV